MERLRSQFLAGVSLQKMRMKEVLPDYSDWNQQLVFLESTLLDPVIVEHPPKWSYQISFLKQCISTLESIADEIRDEFYEHLVELQNKSGAQKWIYKHFVLPSSSSSTSSRPAEIVTIKEAPQIISEGTTGLSCWQAGLFLADWISQNRTQFEGKRVLELGSGTGATGLLISRLCGVKELVLSDCHDHVLRLLRDNVELNGGGGQAAVRVIDLNWESPESALDESNIDPDIVLAADVVYDDSIFAPLIELLLILLGRRSDLIVYLAATVRNEETLNAFLKLAEGQGLRVEEEASSLRVENNFHWDDQTEIKLFGIRLKDQSG